MRRPPIEHAAVVAATLTVLLLYGAPIANGQDKSPTKISAENEVKIKKLAKVATDMYSNRREHIKNCTPSVHGCDGGPQGFYTCNPDVDTNMYACTCAVATERGRKANMDESVIRTPPGTDPDDLSDAVKESICTYQGLEDVFKELSVLLGTYIGTIDGAFRMWPGMAQTRCKDDDEYFPSCKKYDPRVRPWFAAASSGPKDVVLLIDTSLSMELEVMDPSASEILSRWDVTQKALLQLVGTFGINDYINVVTFASEADVLVDVKSERGDGSLLVQGTEENVEKLRAAIEGVRPDGGTDFRSGFSAAFDLLIASEKETAYQNIPPTSNCEKIIIFLTDGEDCSLINHPCKFNGKKANPDNVRDGVGLVLDLIEQKQQQLVEASGPGGSRKRARIFTFSMTSNADTRIPKIIACRNEGSWSPISETDDPLYKMRSYLRFMSWNQRQLDVIWSNVYEDNSGTGLLTTVALPIYSPPIPMPGGAGDIPGVLVAVVGLDVSINELGTNVENIIQRLTSKWCRRLDLTGCQTQILRGEEGECVETFEMTECHFVKAEGHYYVASSDKLPYEQAARKCSEMGGQLPRISTSTERAFLAGLSRPQGSWLGMMKISNKWNWKTFIDPEDDIQYVEDHFLPNNGTNSVQAEQLCATIDPRGPKGNIDPAFCEQSAHFICKIADPGDEEKPAVCEERGTIVIDMEYEYTNPPVKSCKDIELAIGKETAVRKEAIDLSTEDVLAPRGDQDLGNDAVICCCPPGSSEEDLASCSDLES